MKYFLCISVLLFSSLIFSQGKKVKIKTYKNKQIRLEYPNTWKLFRYNGNITLQPNLIKKTDYLGPSYVYVFPGEIINKSNIKSEKELLKIHASRIIGHEENKNFSIIKLADNLKYSHRIDYIIKMDFSDINFKKVEYIYKQNNKLKYCFYLMREDFFKKYYNDAMSIINSIEKR